MRYRSVFFACLVTFAPFTALAVTKTLDRDHVFQAAAGETVMIDVSFHNVEVTARPGDTVEVAVHLEATGSATKTDKILAALDPVFRDDGDTILIRSTTKGFGGLGSAKVKGIVTVAMPPDLDLVVDGSSGSFTAEGDFASGDVRCDASSGSFRLNGAAEMISADLSSGSVELELTRPAQSVRLDTSSGSVRMRGGAHSVNADTSSGSITLHGLLGNASMDASSGSITASWAAISTGARVDAGASSGSVTLTFPAGTVLAGDVSVSSGGIHSDFPGVSSDRGRHLKLTGEPGAVQLHAETSSGGVRLLQR